MNEMVINSAKSTKPDPNIKAPAYDVISEGYFEMDWKKFCSFVKDEIVKAFKLPSLILGR